MGDNFEKIIKFIKNYLLNGSIMLLIIFLVIIVYKGNIMSKEIISILLPSLSILAMLLVDFFSEKTRREINDYYIDAKNAINFNYKIIDHKEIQSNKQRGNKGQKSNDIIELMLLNMKEIKEYYVLSKTMAKRSFLLSVFMCVFGFIIISASIIAIFIIDISFVQLIVPVIGGAVVELIAGTSLVVYKKSLEQLNQYYESLHNNERFLSLVNLVDKLSDDKKDEAYINIINNQLEGLKNS